MLLSFHNCLLPSANYPNAPSRTPDRFLTKALQDSTLWHLPIMYEENTHSSNIVPSAVLGVPYNIVSGCKLTVEGSAELALR